VTERERRERAFRGVKREAVCMVGCMVCEVVGLYEVVVVVGVVVVVVVRLAGVAMVVACEERRRRMTMVV